MYNTVNGKMPQSTMYTQKRKDRRMGVPSKKLVGHVLQSIKKKRKMKVICPKKVERGPTLKVPFIERSRNYWGKEILEECDVLEIDEVLEKGINGNVVLSTAECDIHDEDLHSLLFGRQLSDRTITCWMCVLKKIYPTMHWHADEFTWDFLPANLSPSFEGKNTHFLCRLVPSKNLEVFGMTDIIFVPLNMRSEWHWHLLAIDYKNHAFHFCDSKNPIVASTTCPESAHELQKIDITRFIC